MLKNNLYNQDITLKKQVKIYNGPSFDYDPILLYHCGKDINEAFRKKFNHIFI